MQLLLANNSVHIRTLLQNSLLAKQFLLGPLT